MPRRALSIVVLLLASACSGGETTATTSAGTSTSTTSTTSPVTSSNLVPDPRLIAAGVASSELTPLEADILTTLAIFGGDVPAEFLVASEGAPRHPQWSHAAPTRVIEAWEEVDQDDRVAIAAAIPTFERYVPGALRSLRGGGDDIFSCVPVHSRIEVCRTLLVGDVGQLTDAADYLEPLVAESVVDAYTKFEPLLPTHPAVSVWLDDLSYSGGGYIYGFVPNAFADEEHCDMFIDVLLESPSGEFSEYAVVGVAGVPDGVPQAGEGAATVAHELFHCFQRANGVTGADWLIEGTAMWSEHHVAPARQTEHRYASDFVELFGVPFLARSYDTVFPYLFADINGGGPSAVIGMMTAGTISALDASFSDFWHQVSVTAWNDEPVDRLIDSGDAIPGLPLVEVPVEIEADGEGEATIILAPFSRSHRTFVFDGTSEEDLVRFARLRLDLSMVPAEVRISALAETTEGWEDPELLVGPERVFCRAPVGPCNDVPEDQVEPYVRIVLVLTNTGETEQQVVVPWDTYNPHLHGIWSRIDGPISLISGNASPYSIVGTSLAFDERALDMAEDVGGYSFIPHEDGWECAFAGAYSIGLDPTYGAPTGTSVEGTGALSGPGSGTTFVNDCVFTSSNGEETQVSGLNIPITATGGPAGVFGFEIVAADTLIITGFASSYIYERVSHTP